MRKAKLFGLSLFLVLSATVSGFAQGTVAPVKFTFWPQVTWSATGLTLTYTNGTVYRGLSASSITGSTLSLTNGEGTCTAAAIQAGTDACNYVYDSGSGTALSTSTTFTTAIASLDSLLYVCTTSGGNITGCQDASTIVPLNGIGVPSVVVAPAQSAAASPTTGIAGLNNTAGAGGAQSATTGNGAAGGAQTVTGGAGGLAGSTSGTAGAGGAVTITGGAGGAGPVTGGAGGATTIASGSGGNGSTAGGNGGALNLYTGAVGTGGSPTIGAFTMKLGGSGGTTMVSCTSTTGGCAVTGQSSATAVSAGNVGQVISNLITSGSAVSLTTATASAYNSISLTAGDWDVSASGNFIAGSATTAANTTFEVSIQTGTNCSTPAQATDGSQVYPMYPVLSTASWTFGFALPPKQVNVSATTTACVVATTTFSAGTITAYGQLFARRRD
jgi:hypothetical protein